MIYWTMIVINLGIQGPMEQPYKWHFLSFILLSIAYIANDI